MTEPAANVKGVTINPEIRDYAAEDSIYNDLVHEYITIEYELKPLQVRLDEIKKVLRDLPTGTHDFAGARVTVARNARLDAKKFAETFPQDQYPNLWKSAPDNTELKRTQPPAVIEALQTEGEPRVTIK